VAYPEGSIYQRSDAFDIFRRVHFPTNGLDANQHGGLRTHLNNLFLKHRPSEHSFFATLGTAPKSVVTNAAVLRELYIRYQSLMHATRVSVYYTPMLNTPALRQMKVKIILDDDTADDVLSHHKQLENLFRDLGGKDLPEENEFGDLELLIPRLNKANGEIVAKADELYRASMGAWCIAEILSDDWISALSKGFTPHYDHKWVMSLQYFDEIATGHVEIQHMLETLALTENVLMRYPKMLQPTMDHAQEMCNVMDRLWSSMEEVVKNPTSFYKSMA
jgi:hypothetical protein